jgi:hypothetical protein
MLWKLEKTWSATHRNDFWKDKKKVPKSSEFEEEVFVCVCVCVCVIL